MAPTKKILVLGNDYQINYISFDKLDPTIITLGVNRIWLKYIPSYFFFNDFEILQELEKEPEVVTNLQKKSISFTSDLCTIFASKKNHKIPSWINSYARPNQYKFPDSVTTAVEIFARNHHPRSECIFYFAGVSLKWQSPSHFWKLLNYSSTNKKDHNWYSPRFEKIQENFKKLGAMGYNMVSVHPNSKLNKIMRYESIDNLYVK